MCLNLAETLTGAGTFKMPLLSLGPLLGYLEMLGSSRNITAELTEFSCRARGSTRLKGDPEVFLRYR